MLTKVQEKLHEFIQLNYEKDFHLFTNIIIRFLFSN